MILRSRANRREKFHIVTAETLILRDTMIRNDVFTQTVVLFDLD